MEISHQFIIIDIDVKLAPEASPPFDVAFEEFIVGHPQH
jgi:hypothetical protein